MLILGSRFGELAERRQSSHILVVSRQRLVIITGSGSEDRGEIRDVKVTRVNGARHTEDGQREDLELRELCIMLEVGGAHYVHSIDTLLLPRRSSS